MSWISLLHPSAQIALVIAVVLVILIIVLIGFIAVKSKLNLKVGGHVDVTLDGVETNFDSSLFTQVVRVNVS